MVCAARNERVSAIPALVCTLMLALAALWPPHPSAAGAPATAGDQEEAPGMTAQCWKSLSLPDPDLHCLAHRCQGAQG